MLEWEPHGFGCQVCIDVGREAMMMYRSGADPVAIRASIERNVDAEIAAQDADADAAAEEAVAVARPIACETGRSVERAAV